MCLKKKKRHIGSKIMSRALKSIRNKNFARNKKENRD